MRGTIIITGATGNLGSAVMEKFGENDYQVAAMVSDKRKNDLIETDRLKIFPLERVDLPEVSRL